MNFEEMEAASPASEPALAEWHCDAGVWRQFKAAEGFDAGVRIARNMAIVPVIVMPFLLLLIWLSVGRGYLTRTSGFGMAAIIVVMIGGTVLSGLILWLYRRPRAAAMNTETGTVTVALDHFSINGVRFDWRFAPRGLQYGGTVFRFQNCQRVKTDGIEMLKFTFETTTLSPGRTGGVTENIIYQRVPVPPDKVAEADDVAERLNLRYRSAKREWEEG